MGAPGMNRKKTFAGSFLFPTEVFGREVKMRVEIGILKNLFHMQFP